MSRGKKTDEAAIDTGEPVGAEGASVHVERMAGARAGRRTNNQYDLSDGQKILVGIVQNAQRCVKMLTRMAREGRALSESSVEACTVLSSELGKLLIQDQ